MFNASFLSTVNLVYIAVARFSLRVICFLFINIKIINPL